MKRLLPVVLFVAYVGATLAIAAGTGAEYFVYVGSYTDAPSSAKGIYAWRFAPATGSVTSIGLVAETVNPAYVYATPDRRFHLSSAEVKNWSTMTCAAFKKSP